MVTVYYWGENLYGHVSVSAGGQYLSFAPANSDKSLQELFPVPPFSNGVPSRYIKFENDNTWDARTTQSHHLDETSVSSAIARIKSSQPAYSLGGNNCSHMALKVLHAGLSDHDKSWVSSMLDYAKGLGGRHVDGCGTIDEVEDHLLENASRFAPALARMRSPKAGIATIAAALVLGGKRALIASPADVVRFMNSH